MSKTNNEFRNVLIIDKFYDANYLIKKDESIGEKLLF
jgi:hypothetical protein